MPVLLIAIGNSLRRDDGAGHRVIELLAPPPGVEVRQVFQLGPELAEDVAAAGTVVFVDASIAGEVAIEPVEAAAGSSPMSHSMAPSEVVALARALYGFAGRAWLCHVPGVDFDDGEGLSPVAEANARAATARIGQLVYAVNV